MAKYRRKEEIVEAVQWFKPGDHPQVAPWGEQGEDACFFCGKPWQEHGDLHGHGNAVCPGAWIVTFGPASVFVIKDCHFQDGFIPVDGLTDAEKVRVLQGAIEQAIIMVETMIPRFVAPPEVISKATHSLATIKKILEAADAK